MRSASECERASIVGHTMRINAWTRKEMPFWNLRQFYVPLLSTLAGSAGNGMSIVSIATARHVPFVMKTSEIARSAAASGVLYVRRLVG